MLNPYQTHPAKILNIKQETESIRTFQLKLAKPISFKAGQFFLVSVPGFGEGPFAPCSLSGQQKEIEFSIRQVGTLTEKLHQLKAGDSLDLRGPYGHSWPIIIQNSKFKIENSQKNLLLIAGGMGLVPLRPVILQYLNNKDQDTKIQIFYGVKTPSDFVFKDDYRKWEKAGIDLNLTVDQKMPNWTGHVGLITTLFEDVKLIKKAKCFMVGPSMMYKFVLPKLAEAGFADRDIFISLERRMHCGLGVCQHCAIGPYYVCHDGPVFCWADLKKIGDVYQMM